jgi:phosphoglycolate phosphatase
MTRIVLFDIDGTILRSDGAGRRAMESALRELFGSAGPEGYRYDGKTDRQIARELMRIEGHHDETIDSRMDQLIEIYLDGLGRELANVPGERLQVLPGVTELIDAVERREDAVLGLLTGNVERGAAAKLAAVGIDMSRFRINAFGSDHEHRPELPGIAHSRACSTLGVDLPGSRFIVIGDTPADIECGRGIGARAIGVATGHYTVEELSAYEPAAVFEDLLDTDAVMQAIFYE